MLLEFKLKKKKPTNLQHPPPQISTYWHVFVQLWVIGMMLPCECFTVGNSGLCGSGATLSTLRVTCNSSGG